MAKAAVKTAQKNGATDVSLKARKFGRGKQSRIGLRRKVFAWGEKAMEIEYVAHATFFLRLCSGRRIVIDPYKAHEFGGRFNYPVYAPECDFAVVTHEHIDHAWFGDLRGNPVIVRQAWRDETMRISSVFAYHDTFKGTKFGGYVLMKIIEADGVRLCHLGDLGERLSDEQIAAIGACDAVIVPAGGFYTLDADGAYETACRLGARTVIPCHYRTALCALPLTGVEPFLAHFDRFEHLRGGMHRVRDLPAGVVVLDDAFSGASGV